MRTWVRAVAVGNVLVGGLHVGYPAAPAPPTGTMNIAHRGASGSSPENTVAAVAQAVADRADYVEMDVRLTRDGVPVVLHDARLARTTNVEQVFPVRSPWLVKDFTVDEVRRLDAGSWKAPSYGGERVPVLVEVIDQLAQSPSGAHVEIKDPDEYGWVEGIGAAVHRAVLDAWPTAWQESGPRRVVVTSSDERFVEEFAAAYPEVPVGVIRKTSSSDPLPTFADDLAVRHDNLTPQVIDEARLAGLTVGVWTVDQSQAMVDLAEQVDGVTTNVPHRLTQVLSGLGATYTGTAWPAAETEPPTWHVATSGRYRRRPVTVVARLETAVGTPARWQRASVQRRDDDGRWKTVAQRATDAAGTLKARVPGRRAQLVLRVVSRDATLYPVARSRAEKVPLRKIGTTLQVSGPGRVQPGEVARVRLRWVAADGAGVSGKVKLFQRRRGQSWRYVRELSVSEGHRRVRVRPGGRTMFYEVRGRATWWRRGAVDDVRLRVVS